MLAGEPLQLPAFPGAMQPMQQPFMAQPAPAYPSPADLALQQQLAAAQYTLNPGMMGAHAPRVSHGLAEEWLVAAQ